MRRRQFLSLLAATPSAVLLSQCSQATKRSAWQRAKSENGLLELTLKAQQRAVPLGHQSARLLSYNGQVPGPILEVKAGDRVSLTLDNQLNTPTNLHYHGLHISPDVDNVFREVAAGEQYRYEFDIPQNHPAITGWYHPHYHLMTAEQVFGGLAGPLIVRGELDEIPEIQQASEALLLLQDLTLNKQDEPLRPHPLAQRWGREGNLLLGNGQQNPIIELPQNGLLRLRLINTSVSRIYQLQLPEHPWYLIATDRGAISEPTELETLLLSPGERVELLIPGNREPGDYVIRSLPYDRGTGEMMAAFGQSVLQMPGIVEPMETVIATLRYGESDRTEQLPLPQKLIPVEPLPSPQHTREFILNHGIDYEAGATGFTINDQSFTMKRINTTVSLGDTEDWTIINKASLAHPFHLHTNRFQVVSRNGKPESLLAWKDVVALDGYETVKIRVRFDDFTGKTVYHCHVLDHEDQGMMGILQVI